MNLGAQQSESSFDIKRIIFLILKYWYFIFFSFFVGLAVTYMINRYKIRIYPVTMTILIKDEPEKDNSIVELLYNGRGFTPGKNYYNEEILLKSYPLIKKAVDSLDFNISIWKEGDIKTTEVYPPPIEVLAYDIDWSSIDRKSFKITVLNTDEFELSSSENDGSITRKNFNEDFYFEGLRFKLLQPEGLLNGDKFEIKLVNNSIIANSYTKRLSISWLQKGASIIKLGLNGSTPAKESEFLMQLAKTYQRDDLLNKNETATRTIEFIDEQLQSIRDSLVTLESALQQFKELNYVTGLKDEVVRFYDQIEALSKEEAELTIKKEYIKYLKDYLQEKDSYDEIMVPATINFSNPLLNNQIQQLIDLQLQKNSLERNSNEDNPFILERNKQLSDLKRSLGETLVSLSASLELAMHATKNEIKQIENQLSELPRAEREYVSLNRLFKLSEDLYLILMEKKTEASITQASNTSDIAIVNPPSIGGAITPKTRQNYLLACLVGLGLPIGLIVLVDLLNDRIKFKEDIEKYTSIPFMGVIGHNKKDKNLVVEAAPNSAISESFRSVRSNLDFFINEVPNKVILTTSALSGEGKTFFSNNLAVIYAYSGKKTILIGADMRRPKILQDFEIRKDIGLSDFLAGNTKLSEIIQETRFDGLHIINSGTVPPNPSELLIKAATAELIKILKKEYDYIIIDSPPIGLVTDALILSSFVDHTMYVVRQGFTPVATLKNIDEMHEMGKFSSISIIFNDITVNKYGYSYGYSYGYGYGYGQGNGYGSYYADQAPSQKSRWRLW